MIDYQANYPANMQEAAVFARQTAMPLRHNGRPFEPVGETLRRRVDRLPTPFPPAFAGKLAATILETPDFGDVLRAVLAGGNTR
jgi:hypothetical protein